MRSTTVYKYLGRNLLDFSMELESWRGGTGYFRKTHEIQDLALTFLLPIFRLSFLRGVNNLTVERNLFLVAENQKAELTFRACVRGKIVVHN